MSTICLLSIVCPNCVSVVWTSAVFSVTVISEEACATCRDTSIVNAVLTSILTLFVCLYGVKLDEITSSSYCPTGTTGKLKTPSPLLVVVWVTPVAVDYDFARRHLSAISGRIGVRADRIGRCYWGRRLWRRRGLPSGARIRVWNTIFLSLGPFISLGF